MEAEQWRPIPGREGVYEVSDLGRVRSLDREITTRAGVKKIQRGRILKPGMNRRHRHVALCDGYQCKSYRVHRLVMEAFVGPLPEGKEVRHRDDNPDNNQLSNLVYGTRSENLLDRVRNGTHHMANRTHCVNGHEFTTQNTIIRTGGGRKCRECKRDKGRDYMRAKREQERARCNPTTMQGQ